MHPRCVLWEDLRDVSTRAEMAYGSFLHNTNAAVSVHADILHPMRLVGLEAGTLRRSLAPCCR